MTVFEGFDVDGFWADSAEADEEYTDQPLNAETLATVERALGYKLPAAYVTLMGVRNGGTPRNTAVSSRRTPPSGRVSICGIFSIGSGKPNSLCGEFGSQFWCDEWGYPPIGVYFADCPSGGHDMVCLDYRQCGPTGEPRVVHVDQDLDYEITPLAEDFETFVRSLKAGA